MPSLRFRKGLIANWDLPFLSTGKMGLDCLGKKSNLGLGLLNTSILRISLFSSLGWRFLITSVQGIGISNPFRTLYIRYIWEITVLC